MSAPGPTSRLRPEKEGQDEFLQGEPCRANLPQVGPSLFKHTGGNSSRRDFAVCVKRVAHGSKILLDLLAGAGDHVSRASSVSRINCGKS